MKLAELKEIVDDMIDQVGEEEAWDVEVKYASQPNWPFENSIADTMVFDLEQENPDVVYLAEKRQLGYLPGIIKNELGW